MAYQVVWSSKAVEDLEALASYIARDSQYYAAMVVYKILESVDNLTREPLIGCIVPEIQNDATRELSVYSYRIIYRFEGETITIGAVIHGKIRT